MVNIFVMQISGYNDSTKEEYSADNAGPYGLDIWMQTTELTCWHTNTAQDALFGAHPDYLLNKSS